MTSKLRDPEVLKAARKNLAALKAHHAEMDKTINKLDKAIRIAHVWPGAWDAKGGVQIIDHYEHQTWHPLKRKNTRVAHGMGIEYRRETDDEYRKRLSRRTTTAGSLSDASNGRRRELSAVELAFLKGWLDDLEPEEAAE